MKYAIILFFYLLSICLTGAEAGDNLRLIRTIGDDRDNYIFSSISSAIVSPGKDIFISDRKSHFVAKYDWNGTFVKRAGRFGQGPGDLNRPGNLNIVDCKLYVLDFSNMRQAVYDLELENCEYRRFYNVNTRGNSCYVLHPNRILSNSFFVSECSNKSKGRMRVVDIETGEETCFFDELPIDYKKDLRPKSLEAISMNYSALPVFGVDGKGKNVLVSFQYPDNPIVFYFYSVKGKFLKKFSHQIDKKYRFELTNLNNPPAESHRIAIGAIQYYRKHFLAFIVKMDYKKGKPVGVKNSCLVFGETGKFIDEFPVINGLKVFYISPDGILLAKNYEAEEEKLFIYRLTLPGIR